MRVEMLACMPLWHVDVRTILIYVDDVNVPVRRGHTLDFFM